ncbi:MAG: hypothetical protein U0989_00440 [Azonexus sp.]|nr:hypothetical protein [Azonexus sp.]MDZ4313238.1 hypothetical protein [Azonexus sp.]
MKFSHQAAAADEGHEQRAGGESIGRQGMAVFLQAERGAEVQGNFFAFLNYWRWQGVAMGNKLPLGGLVDEEFIAGAAWLAGLLVNGDEFGLAVSRADAALKGLAQGEGDER